VRVVDAREDLALESIAHARDARHLRQRGLREFRRLAHADDAGDVLRPPAPAALLRAADQQRAEAQPAPDEQPADALGPWNLWDAKLIASTPSPRRSTGIFPTACVPSQWNGTRWPGRSGDLSTGNSTPVSLFAHMIVTSAVSSVIASRRRRGRVALVIDRISTTSAPSFASCWHSSRVGRVLDRRRDDPLSAARAPRAARARRCSPLPSAAGEQQSARAAEQRASCARGSSIACAALAER
jgi:hypothetical protein